MIEKSFTRDQTEAITARRGSRLLSANAGSGKTAVMVERFVTAVMEDETSPNSILALTFTEKAAGELRERVRKRFLELSEHAHMRAVDNAWIGTIHGFCLQVLRSHAVAAGMDPRFVVLDETTSQRLARQAFDSATSDWLDSHDEAADLAVAYGNRRLREIIFDTFSTLRSRGESHPHLTLPKPPSPPAALCTSLLSSAYAVVEALREVKPSKRVSGALAALTACIAALNEAAETVPWPHELEPYKLPRGAKAVETEDCEIYRQAFARYQQACTDYHSYFALDKLGDLVRKFDGEYRTAKTGRRGVDFEDLQLLVRDLYVGDEEIRRRWAERFDLIMVDEFQDTNRLQLEILEALERDNLFTVGDEFQSIYGFRHAEVALFRQRKSLLEKQRCHYLRENFRSDQSIIDVLNCAFVSVFGPDFAPLVAGKTNARLQSGEAELRLFDPFSTIEPASVELLLTDEESWSEREDSFEDEIDAPVARKAEAALLAKRIRQEIAGGRKYSDIAVLLRTTSSLRLFEQTLKQQGIPTYVVGGRGYWSSEQVQDALGYLATLANPLDELALLGTLTSPFCGVGSDVLILLTHTAREMNADLWSGLSAALQAHKSQQASVFDSFTLTDCQRLSRFVDFFVNEQQMSERLSIDQLLERAISELSYDLAVLARSDGERRFANLRKLMGLAREFEASEGRDLRKFIDYARSHDLSTTREGEAALESENLNAVRLMTIHAAKGLEFPVVCVADLGRKTLVRTSPLLVGDGHGIGLQLHRRGAASAYKGLAYESLANKLKREEAEEEKRLFYVAMTRAQSRLILSGPLPSSRANSNVRAPIDWIVPAIIGETLVEFGDNDELIKVREWQGRSALVRCLRNTPETLAQLSQAKVGELEDSSRGGDESPQVFIRKVGVNLPVRPRAGRLSYSSLQTFGLCPYRFYLERVVGLPRSPDSVFDVADDVKAELPELSSRDRGTLVHGLLERLDFQHAAVPSRAEINTTAAAQGLALNERDYRAIEELIGTFIKHPIRVRLAQARQVRREAPFAFSPNLFLDRPEVSESLSETADFRSLINGVVDVVASEADGTTLIIDYKTDQVDIAEDLNTVVAHRYQLQRMIYALAAFAEGAERVEVIHLFLSRSNSPVSVRYERCDIADLASEADQLVNAAVHGPYPVSQFPHRELCSDCPGRASLCSWSNEQAMCESSSLRVIRPKPAVSSTR